ncbi:hypothetical protein KIN20_029949 [Parelaphostrongylus tenuis]|uniref:Uncharacterized protein n=1 Tax=Parelaphostrongylus tenuis TaxID=148309 RepID=A0AAD5R3C6_PARTN|nr:hypothetical protein KIN20_029949 [Parelaphostrongylus tenuis]
MRWQMTTILLCTYGFLSEFNPSVPFIREYEENTLNISEDVLKSQVYPLWTYSYTISLLPLLLITDLILYKSMIIFKSVSYIAVWIMLVFAESVLSQQIVQMIWGFASAAKVAYFFVYLRESSKEEFIKVTAYVRGALLMGQFLSYTIELQGALCNAPTYENFAIIHFKTIFEEIKKVYGNIFMLEWSLWWALTTCCCFQIETYVEPLWGAVTETKNADIYNGLTEALCPLVAFPGVLLTRYLQVNWSKWGELCLAACSFLECAILLMMSRTDNRIIMYIGYILYSLVYETMITIAQPYSQSSSYLLLA